VPYLGVLHGTENTKVSPELKGPDMDALSKTPAHTNTLDEVENNHLHASPATAHEARDEDEVFCKEARALSESLFEQSDAKKAAADAAFDAGNIGAGRKLRAESKEITAAAEAASKAASIKIFTIHNERVGPFEIDLHGLQLEEALEFVQERLDRDVRRGASAFPGIVLIYGAGHHSAGSKQLMKPAVLKLLAARPHGQLLETRDEWDAITGKASSLRVSVAYAGGSLDALLGKGKAVCFVSPDPIVLLIGPPGAMQPIDCCACTHNR
jgi:DNA-nicking Smr family endonuclease